jgi:hypothetical protein
VEYLRLSQIRAGRYEEDLCFSPLRDTDIKKTTKELLFTPGSDKRHGSVAENDGIDQIAVRTGVEVKEVVVVNFAVMLQQS